MKKVIILICIVLPILILTFFTVNTLNKMGQKTMPELEYLSFEDYTVNIYNSILDEQSLEVPPEILSFYMSKSFGSDTVLAVNDDKINLWFKETLPIIDESDIKIEFSLLNYDSESRSISLQLDKIFIGSFEVPDMFYTGFTPNFDNLDGVSFDKQDKILEMEFPSFELDFWGIYLEIYISEIYIKDEKLFFKFMTDYDFNISDFIGSIVNE